ncbi:ClpP/crotonase-like domain-containing protein [Biscogniauxia mediterranea]|nr:ClpP/crotonase-like domain-containing protein [Biscogniauxia mediterranea]
MAPRLNRRIVSPALLLRRLRLYSTDQVGPIIRVTNIDTTSTGHIRVLELNRPASRNAISKKLLADLRAEVDSIHAQYTAEGEEAFAGVPQSNPTRALILASSSDTSFCAGADLRERRGFTPEETADFLANLRDTFSALAALPIPTISAISAYALGGGLELALCTHFRVLASTATVGLPETRLGIIPGAGGTYRLPALIGLPRARDLVLTGRQVSAPEAYFLGLADRLVEVLPDAKDEENHKLPKKARRMVLAEAVRLATEICEGGPVAVRAALQAVAWAREDVENAMYERVVRTEDRNEALEAFREKRKPKFKGR